LKIAPRLSYDRYVKSLAPLLLIGLVLIVVGTSFFLTFQFANHNFLLPSFLFGQPISPSQLLHNGTPDYADFGNVLVISQANDSPVSPTRLQVRGAVSAWQPDNIILQMRTRRVAIHLRPLTSAVCFLEHLPTSDGTDAEAKTVLIDHSQAQESLASYSPSFLARKIAPGKTIAVITHQESPDRWMAEKIVGYGCALNL
jgi:hypothetical protein